MSATKTFEVTMGKSPAEANADSGQVVWQVNQVDVATTDLALDQKVAVQDLTVENFDAVRVIVTYVTSDGGSATQSAQVTATVVPTQPDNFGPVGVSQQ